MKLIIMSLLLLTGLSNKDLLNQIKNESELISNSLNSYKKVETNDVNFSKDLSPKNYSFEGAEIYRLAMIKLIRYYDIKGLRKTIVKFDGDSQDLISEYYYKNDSLILIVKTRFDYKNPKWSDDFNKSEKTVIEKRYYFKEQKLISWISKNNDTSTIDSKIEENLLSDSELYKGFSR